MKKIVEFATARAIGEGGISLIKLSRFPKKEGIEISKDGKAVLPSCIDNWGNLIVIGDALEGMVTVKYYPANSVPLEVERKDRISVNDIRSAVKQNKLTFLLMDITKMSKCSIEPLDDYYVILDKYLVTSCGRISVVETNLSVPPRDVVPFTDWEKSVPEMQTIDLLDYLLEEKCCLCGKKIRAIQILLGGFVITPKGVKHKECEYKE